MRNIVIDEHRRTAKRVLEQPLDTCRQLQADDHAILTFECNEILDRLAKRRPRQAGVCIARFVSGHTIAETATLLGISARTVKRDSGDSMNWLREEFEA
jgi:DNA-directed RNA polymerase specialized sigma24 family protein